jgi:hypothetical protein
MSRVVCNLFLNQQYKQSTCNVTKRRVYEPLLLWKSNKYYTFLCAPVNIYQSARRYTLEDLNLYQH